MRVDGSWFTVDGSGFKVNGSISSFSSDAMNLPLWPVATNRESQGNAKHKAAKLSANGSREQSSGSNSSSSSSGSM